MIHSFLDSKEQTVQLFFPRFNDVWVLELTKMTWSCPNIRGKKPSGRFGHSQVFDPANHRLDLQS